MNLNTLSAGTKALFPDDFASKWPSDLHLLEHNKSPAIVFDPNKVILLANDSNLAFTPQKYLVDKISHIVQVNHPCLVNEVAVAARLLMDSGVFFSSPAETIFGDDFKKVLNVNFSSIQDKDPVLERLDTELRELGHYTYVVDAMTTIADELFTNAVYNAPTSTAEHKHVSVRGEKSEMPLGKFGTLFCAQTDNRLLIGCSDPFGTLDISSYLQRVCEVEKNGAGLVIRRGSGGAGIGCHMIFDLSSEIYLGVHEKVQTVVCYSLFHKLSNKMRQLMPKNLHIILKKS